MTFSFRTYIFLITLFSIQFVEVCAQGSTSQNYVIVNTVKQAGITNDALVPPVTIESKGKAQTISYFDGLGRLIQTVVTQGSNSQKDIVSGIEYDIYGREIKKYLPYVDVSGSTANGSLRSMWKSNQLSFYNGQLSGVEADAYPYNQTAFEASPLNRVKKSFAPGSSWSGSAGTQSEHGVERQYLVNTQSEGVKVFNIELAAGSIPQSSAVYPDGQLYKNVSIDERLNKVIEYKDKEGQLILKKVQLASSPGIDHTGWLCTYYVYDNFNNLRFVIPPKAVDLMLNSTSLTSISDALCFRYDYDERKRMISKKVPGAAEVYMIYDQKDRLIYTQDGNLRGKNQWMTTLYDQLNRPVMTGLTSYTSTREALQNFVNLNTGAGNSSSIAVSQPVGATLILGQRELGRSSYQATTSVVFEDGFSSESGANFTTVLQAGNQSESLSITDNPLPPSNNFIALTLTYYDDYTWTSNTYTTSSNGKLTDGGNPNADPLPASVAAQQRNTQGLITGTRVRVLDNENYANGIFLAKVNYYDKNDRIIQTQSENLKGGLDITTMQYDFSGKILSGYLSHNNLAAASGKLGILTSVKYDAADRLVEIKKTIYDKDGANSNASHIIFNNEYNELGQVIRKNLDPAYNNNAGLETLNYEYNIRGWLLGINRAYARDASTINFFGFDLGYDKVSNNLIGGQQYTNGQYNGNIAGMVWKSKGDQEKRKYDYSYDAANRLKMANFTQYTNGTFNTTAGIDYTVDNLEYDQNGNILKMYQKGWQLGVPTPGYIDKLNYTYEFSGNSNRLQNVKDDVNDVNSKLGDFRTSANHPDAANKQSANTQAARGLITDYKYDENGNLVKDFNKDFGDDQTDGIKYNYLNLPMQITVRSGNSIKGTITYIYDAAGNKLEKIVDEKPLSSNNNIGKNTRTTYVEGTVYENNLLQFFGHEEGRVRRTTDATGNVLFAFDYMLTDHLGNVRSVITNELRIDRYPVATLEGTGSTSPKVKEQGFYDFKEDFVVDKPGNVSDVNYVNDNGTNNPNTFADKTATSQKMYQLNAATNKTGLSRILKVMAGDQISILAKSYYSYSGAATNAPFNANDLINAFLGTMAGNNPAVQHGATSAILSGDPLITVPLNAFTNANPNNAGNNVKAGISYILFDEHFKFVTEGSGFDPVNTNASGGYKPHFIQDVSMPKNGYLYIYCSNESNINVFFDNMEVVHTRGPLVEESHYYPFGLTMSGISSKALNFGGAENRKKFNDGSQLESNEFSDGSGLELYDATFRMYDAQIGRFNQIDPLADLFGSWSPYAFAYDNPVIFNDPLGLAGDSAKVLQEVIVSACPKCNARVGSNIDVAGAVGPPPAEVGNPVDDPGPNNGSATNVASATGVPINVPIWLDPAMAVAEYQAGSALSRYRLDGYGGGRPVLPGPAQRIFDRQFPSGSYARTRPVNVHIPGTGRSIQAPRYIVSATGRLLKFAGVVTAGLGAISTELQFANGKISNAHRWTNHAFTIIGFLGPEGMIISIAYSLAIEDALFTDPAPFPMDQMGSFMLSLGLQ